MVSIKPCKTPKYVTSKMISPVKYSFQAFIEMTAARSGGPGARWAVISVICLVKVRQEMCFSWCLNNILNKCIFVLNQLRSFWGVCCCSSFNPEFMYRPYLNFQVPLLLQVACQINRRIQVNDRRDLHLFSFILNTASKKKLTIPFIFLVEIERYHCQQIWDDF